MFYALRHHHSPLVRFFGPLFIIGGSFSVLSLICYVMYQTGDEVWFTLPLILVGVIAFVIFVISVVHTIFALFDTPGSRF